MPIRSNRRTTTSLYLDDVHVSTLNGALHRAVGGEPGRLSDLIVYAQAQLARIVEAEPTLADGHSAPLAAAAEAGWWRLPNGALHGDVSAYANAWRAVTAAWGPAGPAPVGAELIALSSLSHRENAWRTSPLPKEDPVPPFPWDERWAAFKREQNWDQYGVYPVSTRTARRAEALKAPQSNPKATHAVFKRNQLVFTGKRSASPFSVATDPRHHRLARDLLGPTVIDWLVRHWVSRFTAWQVERWTDAPLYAALHAAYSGDYAFVPSVLDELEENLEANIDMREHGADKYGDRVQNPPGRSRAERLGEAFDVAFADVIDDVGYFLNDIGAPLPHLGVVVLAKRLGLLADLDPDRFDSDRFGVRFRDALGVAEGADHGVWRDAALSTVPDGVAPVDALPTYGAAAIHADAVLHGYLLERTRHPAPRTLLGLLGRGRAIAWPDRWALQRFLGVPVDARFDELRGTTRGGVDLGSIEAGAWGRINEVLGVVGRFEDRTGEGPFFVREGRRRPPRGAYALDGAFVEAVARFAATEVPAYEAARTLVEWMRDQARSAVR